MRIHIAESSLILLVGVSGSGKTTLARSHFKPTEIVSTDHYRAVVSDDENDQSASADAFALVRSILARRLRRGRLTVLDATNVSASLRAAPIRLARDHGREVVAVVLDPALDLCLAQNQTRARVVPQFVIREQHLALRAGLPALQKRCNQMVVLETPAALNSVIFERHGTPPATPRQDAEALPPNAKGLTGNRTDPVT